MRIVDASSVLWNARGVGSGDSAAAVGLCPYRTPSQLWEGLRVKTVTLEQGSAEWLRWRATGIGASESAAAVGLNPYQSARQLWEIKTGRAEGFTGNAHTRRGHALEPIARAWYESLIGVEMTPLCVVHDEHDWLKASLDGWNPDARPGGLVLEIKSPAARNHQRAAEGEISETYRVQIQHQLLVTGASFAHFVSYNEDAGENMWNNFHLIPIRADRHFQRELLAGLVRFWGYITRDEQPPD